MRCLMRHISRLERTAARCDNLAGQRFSQASISSEFQSDLFDQALAFQLQAGKLRIKAARLLLRVAPVVMGVPSIQ